LCIRIIFAALFSKIQTYANLKTRSIIIFLSPKKQSLRKEHLSSLNLLFPLKSILSSTLFDILSKSDLKH
jgi:hypothetical protein